MFAQELLDGSVTSALAAPVHALPVDVFRILAGLVGFTYFARILYDLDDLSSPNGLIDHELCRRVFPPARWSLFRPGVPEGAFRGVFVICCLASLCVASGYHPRLAAGLLFVAAVSTYRWNLFAVYVDDAIAHLVFFWIMLLPVGRTLTFSGWRSNGYELVEGWVDVTVPGTSVRMFLANMALVYLVAGLYKFTSPMWRQGSALQAILKMPISRRPERWGPRHASMLRAGNYWALAMEPLFALMYVAPAGSVLKLFLAASAAIFHLGIILTLKIPFANLAMLGAIPLALGPEIMLWGFGRSPLLPSGVDSPTVGGWIGVGLVASLVMMVLWEVIRSWSLDRIPLWKTHMSGFMGNPWYVLLWVIGIAQSYRLFDWIDSRNYHVRYEVRRLDASGRSHWVDPTLMFPTSLRHLLLQSYVVGNVWLQLPAKERAIVRRSLLHRHARRFADRHPEEGTVEVFAVTQRVTADNLDLSRGERRLLMRFSCSDGGVLLDSFRTAA